MAAGAKQGNSHGSNHGNGSLGRGSKLFTHSTSSSTSEETQNKNGVNVKVILRCRPISDLERREPSHFPIVTTKVETKEVCVSQTVPGRKIDSYSKTFTFDGVCSPSTSQAELFKLHIVPIVEEVLLGFNCTIFAYGQTGTGKTYTMEGDLHSKGLVPLAPQGSSAVCSSTSPRATQLTAYAGLIPRAVQHIFERLEAQETEYSVRVSYLEIYNEELHDLLNDGEKQTLRIYEDTTSKKGLSVDRLEELPVNNPQVICIGDPSFCTLWPQDIYNILSLAVKKRRTAETLLNRQSSRSHCIFSVTIHLKEANLDGEDVIKIGKLNLVDLAGSENIQRSGANVFKDRTKEAGMINQSLLTLGRVINALVERSSYIPYRDSKLTRLLQESLGGRTKTCIIATVSPSSLCLEETLSTLDYAFRAKNIRNRPEVNQKLAKRVVIRELNHEIERLKLELLANREKNGVYLPLERYNALEALREHQSQEISNLQSEVCKAQQAGENLNQSLENLHKAHQDLIQQHTGVVREKEELNIILHQEKQNNKTLQDTLKSSNQHVQELEEQIQALLNLIHATGSQMNSVGSSLAQCQALGYQLVIQMDRDLEMAFEGLKNLAEQCLGVALQRVKEEWLKLDASFLDVASKVHHEYKQIVSERINPWVEKSNHLKERVNRDLAFCLTDYLNYFKDLFSDKVQTFTTRVKSQVCEMNEIMKRQGQDLSALSRATLQCVEEWRGSLSHMSMRHRDKMQDLLKQQANQISELHQRGLEEMQGALDKMVHLQTTQDVAMEAPCQQLQAQFDALLQLIQTTMKDIVQHQRDEAHQRHKKAKDLCHGIAQHILTTQQDLKTCSEHLSTTCASLQNNVDHDTETWTQSVKSFCDSLETYGTKTDAALQRQRRDMSQAIEAQTHTLEDFTAQTFPRALHESSSCLEHKVLEVMEKTDTLHSTMVEAQNDALIHFDSTLEQQRVALESWRSKLHDETSLWTHHNQTFYEALGQTQLTLAEISQTYRTKAHHLFQDSKASQLPLQQFTMDQVYASLPHPCTLRPDRPLAEPDHLPPHQVALGSHSS